MHFQGRLPSREALAWVERMLGGPVVACRRLTGGLTAAVHRVTVDSDGEPRDVVLRQYDAPDHAALVERESRTMEAARTAGLPAPHVLGVSTGDDAGGLPSILMTFLDGQTVLAPNESWVREIATVAARIHAANVTAPPFESWLEPGGPATPSDSLRPELWQTVRDVLASPGGSPETCFIHRDFQHFNFLWSGDKLTGVVDWGASSMGPPSLDIGHCRLNLAILFSADWAERLRLAYEAATGRRVDPWWDLHALAAHGDGWQHFIPIQVDGRAPVDPAGMTSRVEALIAATLQRL